MTPRRIRIVSLPIAIFVLIPNSLVYAAIYYASPTGSDSNPGTIDQPWKTFNYAQGRLVEGDTLYLRGGTYFEDWTIWMSIHGTSSAWITIQSYPGEEAVISGALRDFYTAPNSAWVLVDPAINLYKTSQPVFFSDGVYYPGAWLVTDDISLIQYDNYENLISTNYTPKFPDSCYHGPGIMLKDSFLYIRLEPNPNDLTDAEGNPIPPVPANYNPNQTQIAVWTYNTLVNLWGLSYVHFKNLTFAHSGYIMDSYQGSSHIELDHCKIKYGSYGVIVRNNAVCHDWYIHDCDFTNGVPDWITWTDVKLDYYPEAYPEFQSNALGEGTGSMMINFLVEKNVFHNIFDGMDIPPGSQNVIVRRNVFKYSKDDAINIFKDVSNIEVAHNLFWRVASGISCLPHGNTAGPVYIHHNIIDNSHLQRLGRPVSYNNDWGSKKWITLDPFAWHDGGSNAWWRVYNNTIITRYNTVYKDPAGPTPVFGNPEKYVYNNIFYIRDTRRILINDLFSSGAHFDGDVFYQVQPICALLENFGDGGTYWHLADFRAANPTSDWEITGLEVDPQFDFTKIDNPIYDVNIWERYRPANTQVFTRGHSYAGLNWPDTQNVKYRGAIPPEGSNLDQTGSVDFADFAIFAKHWLEADCFPPMYCQGADIDKRDGVNMQDLDEFAADWLNQN